MTIERFNQVIKDFLLSDLISAFKGAEVYLVGGAVRNLILEQEIKDIDLATNLTPDQLIGVLSKTGFKVYPSGIDHGTVTVLIKEDFSVEITTFRTPGMRNQAEFSETIDEDLAGRDFTINAIAYDLQENRLIDPFGGEVDLKAKLIRAVADPELRFQEDPLRIMRMVRIAAEYSLAIDPLTWASAKLLVKEINNVSIERIREELNKILLTNNVRIAFQQMYDLGILAEVLPEMLPSYNFEQNEYHSEDVFNHTLSVIEQSVPELKVRLSALFHDFGKPASFSVGDDGRRHFYSHELISAELAKQVMERFKYSKKMIKSVSLIARNHMRPLSCGPAAVRRILRDLGDDFDDWFKLKQADYSSLVDQKEFLIEQQEFLKMCEAEKERQASPVYGAMAIDGYDLQELGFSEGKEIGETLRKLDEILIEKPELNQKEKLIDIVKSWQN